MMALHNENCVLAKPFNLEKYMALIAKSSGGGGGTFTPVPEGMYLGRCYRIIDMGTQTGSYQGKPTVNYKVMLQFEVHGEDAEGAKLVTPKGEPMSISKNYTLSLNEKATLRKDLQTWRGKLFTIEELNGFQLKNVLGAWALLNIAKGEGGDGNQYTNIVAINPVPKMLKDTIPNGHNPLVWFDLDNPDMELFETFGNKLREKIKSSPEWKAHNDGGHVTPKKSTPPKVNSIDEMDDDIPF
jgi:hypothetical protein